MPDRDWIANLLPYEAEATLKSITQSMEGPRSAREATEFHRLQKVLKAKAESTYEPAKAPAISNDGVAGRLKVTELT